MSGPDRMGLSGNDLSVHQFAEMRARQDAYTLLDIREPNEVAICAIADSITIPMQQLASDLGALPREDPLVVICHHGMRSAMVTDFLRKQGFENAWNLAGGIDAWARHIEPDMPRY